MSPVSRRLFLQGVAAAALTGPARSAPQSVSQGKPTNFLIACMTLPYSPFPLDRALTGIKAAGYRYVAWGTSHREDGGKGVPVMAADAPTEWAKELGKKCRDLGLEPLMM